MEKRTKALRIILVAAVALVLVRLFVIQIFEHDMWVKRAEQEHVVQYTIPAERGEIYMMDGGEPTVVVMNETVWTVIVDPMTVDEEATKKLIDEVAKDKLVSRTNLEP